MGLFDSKAKRIAVHRQLLDLAKATLESLKVEVYKSEGEVTSPVWTDTTKAMLPLEYRWWVSLHLETLVCAVHDTEDSELGDRDWIRELSESVTAVRSVAAGLPDSVRNTFRAEAFARAQGHLDETIAHVARDLATNRSIVFWDGPLEDVLKSAKEAMTWFGKQDDLDAANALRKDWDKRLPTPNLYTLGQLVRDGDATLAKVHEDSAARKRDRQP